MVVTVHIEVRSHTEIKVTLSAFVLFLRVFFLPSTLYITLLASIVKWDVALQSILSNNQKNITDIIKTWFTSQWVPVP